MTDDDKRVLYISAVYDEAEIEAVNRVLRSGKLGIGANVAEMERRVAEMTGKRHGIMCNSGSSALYLAVELLGLQPGDEVITSPLTFSTDVAPIVRAGLVPVFVDVEPDTFNVDVSLLEAAVSDKTKAILLPNLVGNAPDWDVVREVADRHGLKVIEDGCDSLGPKLRGTPTATRADISVTSFALSHIITAGGTGGMVLLDDDELRERCLLLRRWGRRSEVQVFGGKGERSYWEDLDGVAYDSGFIFDELGWNFEPNEISAAFGVEQLKKVPVNFARRRRNFQLYTEFLGQYPEYFILPRELEGLETAWHTYTFQIRPDAPFTRGDLQQYLEPRGVDTRTVWTGNVTRHPMLKNAAYRIAGGGLPNADQVMKQGILVSGNHGLDDDAIARVTGHISDFLKTL
ncbi:DegT/DnrJ/EryC1/StrS family aminotransferase [Yinghuangia soli]|uniref:DegT/DnrJ/EryC1/StrS family aminotransferase n=1 Tax=Yinghuangia soli TaxID=2908204 RepID=A0AA41U2W4_9ACTN|nr:DegT/DnrJ/EryC1/StrS family aminotransferase [Yinghuangia soli]MCF2531135.1 DegT/DnrJ/EryC1/StrS family aminotransferase [Yinghuangia soli]